MLFKERKREQQESERGDRVSASKRKQCFGTGRNALSAPFFALLVIFVLLHGLASSSSTTSCCLLNSLFNCSFSLFNLINIGSLIAAVVCSLPSPVHSVEKNMAQWCSCVAFLSFIRSQRFKSRIKGGGIICCVGTFRPACASSSFNGMLCARQRSFV